MQRNPKHDIANTTDNLKERGMNLLEGAIAFALAMAGLATLCTALVELLHRLAGLRADGLRSMLEAYVDDVIQQQKLADPEHALRRDLLDKLTNSALIEKIHRESDVKFPLLARFLGALYRKNLLRTTAVSTEHLLQRLPETALFEALKNKAVEDAQTLARNLADKYDRYGDAATDYFKRRAQLLSILVGVALAFAANINAVRIFDAFIKDPILAQRMEAQADTIRATIEQAPANAQFNPRMATQQVREVQDALHAYQNLGLPIGWNHYPNCQLQGAQDPQCQALGLGTGARNLPDSVAATLKRSRSEAFIWLTALFFSGVLIGLGGPFWFDLAVRLSQVRQLLTGRPALQAAAAPEPALTPRDQAVRDLAARLTPTA